MGSEQEHASWRDRYGPWALVTGASDGIGRAFAEALAARRINVVLVARRLPALQAIAAEIETRFGVSTRLIAADLEHISEIRRTFDGVSDLDIGLLVASAGFGTAGPFLQTDLDAELGMIDLNCRAVTAMTKMIALRLAKRGGGIVLFGSIVAYQGVPNAANYAATKAFVQTLAEGLAPELAHHGIDVLSCAPGPVHSGFAERSRMQMGQAMQPKAVAEQALMALGRKTTVWPGMLSKILIGSLATLPRFARTAIMGRIMAGMTKHLHGSQSQT